MKRIYPSGAEKRKKKKDDDEKRQVQALLIRLQHCFGCYWGGERTKDPTGLSNACPAFMLQKWRLQNCTPTITAPSNDQLLAFSALQEAAPSSVHSAGQDSRLRLTTAMCSKQPCKLRPTAASEPHNGNLHHDF
ncbi:unnamed protein product [Leuciscus chuanchicus]